MSKIPDPPKGIDRENKFDDKNYYCGEKAPIQTVEPKGKYRCVGCLFCEYMYSMDGKYSNTRCVGYYPRPTINEETNTCYKWTKKPKLKIINP